MIENKTNSQQLETVIVEKLIAYKNSEKVKGTASGAMSKQLMSKEITGLFQNLFESSIKDNHYFFDCAMGVYEHTFKERYDTHKRLFSDSHPEDDILISFLKHEVHSLFAQEANRFLVGEGYATFVRGVDDFKITARNKKLFLKSKLNDLKWTFFPEIEDELSFGDPDPEHISFVKFPLKAPILEATEITNAQIVLLLDELGFFKLEKISGKPVGKIALVIHYLTRGLYVDDVRRRISNLTKDRKKRDPQFIRDERDVKIILDNLIK